MSQREHAHTVLSGWAASWEVCGWLRTAAATECEVVGMYLLQSRDYEGEESLQEFHLHGSSPVP